MAAVAALIALAANGSAPAQQFGVFTVTTTADGNDGECTRDCTLREAVSLSTPSGGSSINLPPGVYKLTLGTLVLRNNAFILGVGQLGGFGAGARTTIIDGRNSARVLQVPAGSSPIVAGVTITGGRAASGAGALVESGGQLHLYNSIVEDNTATTRGGGIQALGTIALQNSLVTGNRTTAGSGGGLAAESGADAIILASTLSGNSATTNGGGIVSAASITVTNATIAGNNAQSGGGLFQEGTAGFPTIWNSIINGAGSGGACGGTIATISHSGWSTNLADDASCGFAAGEGVANADARLGALHNNGGPTDTRALGAGSPAINASNPSLCFGNDQRGAPPVNACDIGAFEFGGKPPVSQLPPPVPGETVNASLKAGHVRVKLPGSDEFFELKDGQQLPVGSTIDTTKGRVTLIAAANNTGKTQRGWFYEGLFKLGQSKGSKPLTTLKMTGKLSCGRSSSANAAAKKKKKRHLWGDGKGKFRTTGSFSSATVRGTRWRVEDTCQGTRTTVKRGTVTVRDFVKRKNVIVHAGHQYFARKK